MISPLRFRRKRHSPGRLHGVGGSTRRTPIRRASLQQQQKSVDLVRLAIFADLVLGDRPGRDVGRQQRAGAGRDRRRRPWRANNPFRPRPQRSAGVPVAATVPRPELGPVPGKSNVQRDPSRTLPRHGFRFSYSCFCFPPRARPPARCRGPVRYRGRGVFQRPGGQGQSRRARLEVHSLPSSFPSLSREQVDEQHDAGAGSRADLRGRSAPGVRPSFQPRPPPTRRPGQQPLTLRQLPFSRPDQRTASGSPLPPRLRVSVSRASGAQPHPHGSPAPARRSRRMQPEKP